MSQVDPKEKSAVSEEAEHWPLNAAREASQDRGQSWPVGPEYSSQLIMLKESFRKVIIYRHEPGYIFRDLLPNGCVAFSPFPTARGRRASPSALRVPDRDP